MGKPTQKDAVMLLKLYELRSNDQLFDASMWFRFEFKVKNYEEFKEKYLLQNS